MSKSVPSTFRSTTKTVRIAGIHMNIIIRAGIVHSPVTKIISPIMLIIGEQTEVPVPEPGATGILDPHNKKNWDIRK